MRVNIKDFTQALADVSKFASKDELLPLFGCVHVAWTDEGLVMEATDRYVMGRFTIGRLTVTYNEDEAGKLWSILLPPESWRTILAVFSPDRKWLHHEMVTVGVGMDGLTVCSMYTGCVNRSVTVQGMDGEFPKLGHLLQPTDEDTAMIRFGVDKLKTLTQLRSVGVTGVSMRFNPDANPQKICVSADTRNGIGFTGVIMAMTRES